MSDLYIYCLTSKKYNLFKYLPSNIIPLGLGDNLYPKDFLNEKEKINRISMSYYQSRIYFFYMDYLQEMYLELF